MAKARTYLRAVKLLRVLGASLAVALLAVLGAQASPVAPGTVPNPPLDGTCGLDVVLVLDESGSINFDDATGDVRGAAEAFVAGLEGTGSQLAIVEFNSRARFPIPFTPVTSATITSVFSPYINDTGAGEGYDPSEYDSTEYWTNWDDALQEVEASNADSLTPTADLVVFVTDGDPTAYNDTHPSDPDNTDVTYGLSAGSGLTLTQAADHADAVKAGGSHILAAGVGNALANAASEGRLQAISGDQEHPSLQPNLRDADYLLVTDFQALEDEFRNLTAELAVSCTASVDVTKLVDEADGNGYQAASGWTFTADVSPSSGTFEWVEPGPAAPATPRNDTTDATGGAYFEWRTFDASASSSVTLTETAQAGYEFVSVSCSDEDGPMSVTQSPSFTLSGLAADDEVSCTVSNKRQTGTLRVVKEVVNDHGGNASASDFLLHVKESDVDVAGSPAAGSAGGTVYELPTGTYEVGETGVAAGYSFAGFSGDCGAGGFVSVEADQESVCVVTNDDQPADLTVITVVVNDDGGSAVPADTTATINGLTTVGSNSFPGSDFGVNRTLASVGAYDVSSSDLAGYSRSYSADCDASIALGESKTCTITYDDQPAGLEVITVVVNDDGGSAVPSDSTESVSGVSTVEPSSFPGDSGGVELTLTSVGDYDVSSSGIAGYSTSYSEDCSASIALGESKVCTITHDDIAPVLTVVKHVVNDNGGSNSAPDFTITVSQDAQESEQSFPGDEQGTDVTLVAGAYSVSEQGPEGYEGSFSEECEGALGIGETATCVITNDDVPPPPPPPPPPPVIQPAPQIDLVVTKNDRPDPVSVGGEITYTLTVTNKGPSPATGVMVTDVLAVDQVSFVSASAEQGSCTFLDPMVTCQLGAIPVGGVVEITIVVVADGAGNVLNEAVVTGNEPEANMGDNRAVAETTVQAPFTPPAVCQSVTVTKKNVKVGKRTVVKVMVRDQSGKAMRGLKIRANGAGIRSKVRVNGKKVTKRYAIRKTNRKGVARFVIKARKPGIIRFRVQGAGSCSTRVGALGVFQPPVTG